MPQNCGVGRIIKMVCYSSLLSPNFTISKTVSQHEVQETTYIDHFCPDSSEMQTPSQVTIDLVKGIGAYKTLFLHQPQLFVTPSFYSCDPAGHIYRYVAPPAHYKTLCSLRPAASKYFPF
jgi:hypothetical protein